MSAILNANTPWALNQAPGTKDPSGPSPDGAAGVFADRRPGGQMGHQPGAPSGNPRGGRIDSLVGRWRKLARRLGPGWGLALVWLMGLALWRFPALAPPLTPFLTLSAVALARGRASFEDLVKAAMVFWLYWTVLGLYLTLFGWANPKNPGDLAAKLALGLHLILLWTPMELGGALKRFLAPLVGKGRAAFVSLGLVVILKVLPGLMTENRRLQETLKSRAGHLSYLARLILLGRNLLRLESQRAEELVRALMSR